MNVTEIKSAALTSSEAAAALAIAAQAAIEGKGQIDAGKAKGAAAEAVMIAGFSDDTAAMLAWSFDIEGGEGAVHHHVETVGYSDHGTETAAWVFSGQGKISRVAQGAYKRGFHRAFFALPDAVPAVWTMVNRALPLAAAIREESMIARIEAGALKLEGGNTDRAKAMREATSLAALRKAVAGNAGSNREAPQNGGEGEGEGAGATVELSRADIIRAASGQLRMAAAGDGPALNETEIALVKALAKVAAEIVKAEAAAEKAEKAEAARKAARAA